MFEYFVCLIHFKVSKALNGMLWCVSFCANKDWIKESQLLSRESKRCL